MAQFYERLFGALRELRIEARILARPYEHKSRIPFAEDDQHEVYARDRVQRYWRILIEVGNTLEEFRGRFLGNRRLCICSGTVSTSR